MLMRRLPFVWKRDAAGGPEIACIIIILANRHQAGKTLPSGFHIARVKYWLVSSVWARYMVAWR